jgi:hypothetical protein
MVALWNAMESHPALAKVNLVVLDEGAHPAKTKIDNAKSKNSFFISISSYS